MKDDLLGLFEEKEEEEILLFATMPIGAGDGTNGSHVTCSVLMLQATASVSLNKSLSCY